MAVPSQALLVLQILAELAWLVLGILTAAAGHSLLYNTTGPHATHIFGEKQQLRSPGSKKNLYLLSSTPAICSSLAAFYAVEGKQILILVSIDSKFYMLAISGIW